MEGSTRMLKQSGMDDKPSVQLNKQSSRYPTQYEDNSIRSEINESEIANYVHRAANNASTAAAAREQVYSCTNGYMCDLDTTIEDCPQNACYQQYLDPKYDILNINDSSNRRVLFDQMQDVLSTKISYDRDTKLNPEKNRLDDLLLNKNIPCDYNQMERQAQIQDLQKAQNQKGTCNGSNPNACDPSIPNGDCDTRECYKKYLSDLGIGKKVSNKESERKNEDSRVTRASMKQQYDTMPIANSGGDYKKKYNTLVVNSDVVVPDFIDVLVVMSETPIKIMLPSLNGPKIESTVGKISSTSNLLIKNLSLCSHQIVSDGKNKIDTVRTSVAVEPAGKKTFGAIHDTWILL